MVVLRSSRGMSCSRALRQMLATTSTRAAWASSSTSFTCFAFCLREWLSCRNMANFSFAILLLDYLTRRQGTFSLRRCLQTLDHLMQELLRVCAAFSRSCG